MSLASPLSVGDIILLAGIAYELGKAFSSGHQSAPAEFAEVQSLLFSTGDALELVCKTFGGKDQQDLPDDTAPKLDAILKNCQAVLKSLQRFVDKYSILDPAQASKPGTKGARLWTRDILKNFKKVAWTIEGEGITKLKQTLTAHVQALSLAVTAINGKKQAITHEHVTDTWEQVLAIRTKLDEIHTWFEGELKRSPPSHCSPLEPGPTFHGAGNFALYEERGDDDESQEIVCPHASFEDLGTVDSGSETNVSERNIFKCACSSKTGVHNLQYTILPFSVFVQVIGKHSDMRWQVYVRSPSSNRPVSLTVRNIDPREISELEQQVDQAALHSVVNHLSNGLHTSFVQTNQDTISVLRMKTNSTKYAGKLLNSIFRIDKGAFTVGRLTSIQILQYGTNLHLESPTEPACTQLSPQPHVNIVLNCMTDDPQAQRRYTVRLNQETNVSVTERPRYVTVDDAMCFQETTNAGSQRSSPSNPIKCSKITLEFSNSTDAQEFLADLKDAKKKLRMQHLQQVRWGDTLISQLDIAGVLMIRNLILQDVQLKIILEEASGIFRMVLVRRDHSAAVTFELPPTFVDDITGGKVSEYENYPAWFMDIRKDGITIVKQESGMNPLATLAKAFRDRAAEAIMLGSGMFKSPDLD